MNRQNPHIRRFIVCEELVKRFKEGQNRKRNDGAREENKEQSGNAMKQW